ncbi:hypothetical protein COCON_G00071080 [Conger conger]|uniref:TRIM8/14/16/25/29/45/65 coiled-coil region domain-containing protein n=1 Tax=Conger conger TaxID=82655 RepID=A0A9Q1DTB2_CONCO|nr:hypothetical protein COCON_G00071080 [Conger conger]
MIRSIERRCSEVKELIRDQEKAEVSRAEGLLERLEQEIAELRRRDAELEQLSHTEDHIHFLQSCQSLCAPPGPGDLPSITVRPHVSFKAVRKSVSASERKEEMEEVWNALKLLTMDESVKEVHTVKLRTREDFLKYYCHLTLDPNTARVYLDHKAGILSFYSVAGTMTRLHRIETKFTQPLYPGFWLDENCSVKLVDLESEPEKKALQPDKKEK